MSGYSNVGNRQVYEAGDQRNYKESEINERARYEEGAPHSHIPNDSKDERSIANRLAREEQRTREGEPENEETHLSKKDPTLPARVHGNEPSRGAKIDQQLKEEDEQMLKKKGAWGSKH